MQHSAGAKWPLWPVFTSEIKVMAPQMVRQDGTEGRKGVGPLIPPWQDSLRPLRQQVFERVRAAGLIPRVQVAKDLGISPASVTTLTLELIEAGLIEEVAARRDADAGRGRPAVALGVRADAHRVAGLKLSDREHLDAAVLDVIMDKPDSGFALARRIRDREENRNIPIVLLTALNAVNRESGIAYRFSDRDRDEQWLPVDRILNKPIRPDKLVAIMRELIGGA